MSDGPRKAAPKKGDLYLIGGCLLAALVFCGLWLALRQDGGVVIVEQDGRETARYALDEDRTVRIEGAGGYNLLAGQSIVCLPHKLAVRIAGGASPLDAVTGG